MKMRASKANDHAIDAAALQQHLAASILKQSDNTSSRSVSTSSKRIITSGLTPRSTPSGSTSQAKSIRPSGASDQHNSDHYSTTRGPRPTALTLASRRECESCGTLCPASDPVCRSCLTAAAREPAIKQPQLTLAQARGLVPAPRLPLTEQQWQAVEAVAHNRLGSAFAAAVRDREALKAPDACSICLQPFGLREQVLLSCSHLFHRRCLDSLERYAKTTDHEPACPECRQVQYQRRATRVAAVVHVLRMVVRLQALFRGHACRTIFFEMRRQLYLDASAMSSGVGMDGTAVGTAEVDTSRKRAFLASALRDLHRRLAVASSRRGGRLDDLLHESDATVQQAREALRRAEERRAARSGVATADAAHSSDLSTAPAAQARPTPPTQIDERRFTATVIDAAIQRLQESRPVPVRSVIGVAPSPHTASEEASKTEAVTVDWPTVRRLAARRGHIGPDAECPVCLVALHHNSSPAAEAAASLLSCGHALHSACLSSLESFAALPSSAFASAKPVRGACTCPVCRAPYVSTQLEAPTVDGSS